jgi:ribonucleoside-diphosphate reductase alpha chain
MIEMYAIFQKFCGQSISADFYRQFEEGKPKQISAKELLMNWFYRIKCGMKTQYYTNTAAGLKVEDDCESCKL